MINENTEETIATPDKFLQLYNHTLSLSHLSQVMAPPRLLHVTESPLQEQTQTSVPRDFGRISFSNDSLDVWSGFRQSESPMTKVSNNSSSVDFSSEFNSKNGYPVRKSFEKDLSFKRRRYSSSTTKSCSLCMTDTTERWLEGPDGPETLCNNCGIHYLNCLKSLEESK